MTHPLAARLVASSLLIAAAFGAASAAAQDIDPQKLALAQSLFNEAQLAMDAKDYATACPKLEEVTRILPNGVGGQLTLAACYEGAGRLASAWMTYTLAQTAAAQANRREFEQRARAGADALKPKLSRLTVTIPEAVRALPGLAVERDGTRVDPALWDKPIPVDKGRHTVVATATGKQRWETTVDVPRDGAETSVDVPNLVDLVDRSPPQDKASHDDASTPPAGPRRTADEPPAAPSPTFWSAQRVTGTALAAAGLVGIGVGSVFGAVAIGKKNDSNDGHCTGNRCDDAGKQLREDGLTAATASTVAFIAGGAALAAGVTVFFLAPSPSAPQDPSVGLGMNAGALSVLGAW